jgi:hypothetical protein
MKLIYLLLFSALLACNKTDESSPNAKYNCEQCTHDALTWAYRIGWANVSGDSSLARLNAIEADYKTAMASCGAQTMQSSPSLNDFVALMESLQYGDERAYDSLRAFQPCCIGCE